MRHAIDVQPSERAGLPPIHPADPAIDSATTRIERDFAELLAGVMRVERVPVDNHFFEELGADSLVMAQFCARVRKRADLPTVSIPDVYHHPTISALAVALADAVPTTVEPSPRPATEGPRASTRQYVVCGALQLLAFVACAFAVGVAAAQGSAWISAASGPVALYLRAVVVGVAVFAVWCAAPVVVKWLLVGRWKPQEIQIWSLAYVRFWVVKTLVRSNPVSLLFPGTPLWSLYLRALGAKVGKGAVIFSPHAPVCSDLVTIGDGAVIRRDAFSLGYRAHAGRIEIGPVTLGRDVYVGEKTVLDINTSMGDRAQLGHASSLHSGQVVPAGERWHGSPARRTDVDYLRVAPARCGTLRRVSFCAFSLLSLFALYLPLAEGGLALLLSWAPSLENAIVPLGTVSKALVLSLVLFFGGTLAGLVFVGTVPRVLNGFLTPDTVYPLFGFHDRVHRAIARMTNLRFFGYLFGDSAFVVHYLRFLGWDLSRVEQTGSNFGTEVMHVNPYLSVVGSGTMVADGLSMINDDVSSTSFRVARASVGPRNFVGNNIAYPAGGRAGENCLLATKAMIPLDGEVREGVGLLGSPCFEIPRSVDRDSRFDHMSTGDALRRNLAAKTRYNIRTIGVFLWVRWLALFLVTLIGMAAVDAGITAPVATALFIVLSVVATVLHLVLVERWHTRFGSLEPTYCSIYHPYFWRGERLWKLPAMEYLHLFDGTPFRSLIWRALGVRIGKRVFDDGCYLTERTLAAIGDDCTLNVGSKIQCHSQEDGAFKSDHSTLGAGCTLGVGAHVHYGVTMGDGSVLAPDSFLMKGEEVPPHTRWGGNPAREM